MRTGDAPEDVFRRLLAQEVGTGADARAIAAATRRLCEHFAHRLTPLLGDGGVAAIYTRCLYLAQRQFPVRALVDTSDPERDLFTRVQQFLEHQQPAVATEAAVVVLTTAGELLASLIGKSLTKRLLHEAWPDDFAAGAVDETST